MKNIHYAGLQAMSTLIRDQEISPVDIVEACLTRIEQRNSKINAFITVLADEARAQAIQAEREIQAGQWRGPLHGIPIGLKDMYDTASIRTTAAFEHFKNRVPAKDAHAVSCLKAAGAIIIGKTNMHTLAMGTTSHISFFGPVHNPWNAQYIAGGSSGGSAAAVASGMCYATIDTDAIGSTRLPAACCGVVGYKCTWGLIDNSGILDGEQAEEMILKLATVGITTRDVADTALVTDVLAQTAYAETVQSGRSSRSIGVMTNVGATRSLQASFDEAVAVFKTLGYALIETIAPLNEHLDIQQLDQRRQTANTDIFNGVDVLMLPTTISEVLMATAIGDDPQALSPQHTFFVNYYGLPAISIPCGFDEKGLPLGLQIVGKQGGDATVLQVAHAYQQTTTWHKIHPAA
jgi:aspartyl-tRNA(Asn)/glutamyl-tRNA(Gln) amidotransferase subunit A